MLKIIGKHLNFLESKIINKMPLNDAFPFDDKDGKTWYKIGYRSGWDSGK